LHLERNAPSAAMGTIRLESADGRLLEEWHGFQNAATLDGAVRARIGAPDYAPMQKIAAPGGRE
jgi:hypothetical protein